MQRNENPLPELLPKERPMSCMPGKVIGTNYFRSIQCRAGQNTTKQVYNLLFLYRINRGLYIKSTTNTSAEQFIGNLKGKAQLLRGQYRGKSRFGSRPSSKSLGK